MMQNRLWRALGLALLLVFGANAVAQDSISVPADSKFVMQINLQAFKNSKVGSTLFEIAKKAAMEEVGKNLDSKGFSGDKIQEVLGLDPFEEIQSIVMCASEYENPENSLLAMVRLKKTTGNIEGLLLAIPGYEQSEHGKYRIHSAAPDNDEKVYGAIHKDTAGDHTLVLGANRNAVTGLLDSLDAKSTESKTMKSFGLQSDRKLIAHMQLMEFPTKQLGEGPQKNIAAMLNSLIMTISEEDDELEVRGVMQTNTEKMAEQIKQSIQGLVAMAELVISMDDEEQDEDAKQVIQFVKSMKVVQEGDSVSLRLRFPSADIAEMIKKEVEGN
jgi:hypothetical protein